MYVPQRAEEDPHRLVLHEDLYTRLQYQNAHFDGAPNLLETIMN